jgi:outer membrane protein assembly factor BamB
LMIAVVAVVALVALVGCGKKKPVQSSTPNTEATKPEPTKAKVTVGIKLWEFETGGKVTSSPAIGSDGTVYVGSYDNKLLCHQWQEWGQAMGI